MKYLKILISVLTIIVTMSCKKTFVFTQADLIGTWTEVAPCISPPYCYNFQFNSNDTVIEYGGGGPIPDTITSPYKLFNDNAIQMNKIINAQGNSGNTTYQISGDANDLTILGFLPVVYSQSGYAATLNIHLKKN